MVIYTPVWKRIWDVLVPLILKFLSEKKEADFNKIAEMIKGLKQKDEEEFRLIDFDYMTNYSNEVHEILVDMIRHSLIEETNKGYILTRLGKSFVQKNFEGIYRMKIEEEDILE